MWQQVSIGMLEQEQVCTFLSTGKREIQDLDNYFNQRAPSIF
ncbi:unnamed protein product [Gulo gulo]|uniref:Uncharacterized protein n=1 Tax=Gulo gulo TaxID=48420 RepID=A0A9X9PWW6_GULGU|nr:unnamed protein product [Gulo gulo]